jgi:hypothetical protein
MAANVLGHWIWRVLWQAAAVAAAQPCVPCPVSAWGWPRRQRVGALVIAAAGSIGRGRRRGGGEGPTLAAAHVGLGTEVVAAHGLATAGEPLRRSGGWKVEGGRLCFDTSASPSKGVLVTTPGCYRVGAVLACCRAWRCTSVTAWQLISASLIQLLASCQCRCPP